MRIQLIGLATALSIAAPLAAFAGEPGDATETAQPAAVEQQDNPMVCHYYYYEGMVIRKPTCRTQHEWERRRSQFQKDFWNCSCAG